MKGKFSRRSFLAQAAIASGGLLALLTGCAPSQPTPTPVPAKPAEAPKPTEAPKPAAPAPTPKPAAKGPIPISMWFHDPLYVKFFGDRADAWAKQNNVTLQLDIVQVPGAEIATKFIGTLVAGTGAPDIIGVEQGWMPRLFKEGLAEKAMLTLNDRIKEVRAEFSEAKWQLYTWKGRTYGCESAMCTVVFYYRNDVFEQLGLKGDMPTMNDYLSTAKQFRAKGKYIQALSTGPASAPGEWLVWFLQRGGNIFNKEGEVILDQGDHADATTEHYVKMIKDDLVFQVPPAAGPIIAAAQKDGSLVGAIGADWYSDYVLKVNVPDQKGLWRCAPLAAWEGSKVRTGGLGGTGMGIPLQSKNIDTAWEILNFAYLTLENQILRWQMIRYFPNMVKAWKDPRIAEDADPFFGNQKWGGVLAVLSPDQPIYYAHAYKAEALTLIGTELLTPVIKGEKKSKQAIKEVADKLRDMIAKGK